MDGWMEKTDGGRPGVNKGDGGGTCPAQGSRAWTLSFSKRRQTNPFGDAPPKTRASALRNKRGRRSRESNETRTVAAAAAAAAANDCCAGTGAACLRLPRVDAFACGWSGPADGEAVPPLAQALAPAASPRSGAGRDEGGSPAHGSPPSAHSRAEPPPAPPSPFPAAARCKLAFAPAPGPPPGPPSAAAARGGARWAARWAASGPDEEGASPFSASPASPAEARAWPPPFLGLDPAGASQVGPPSMTTRSDTLTSPPFPTSKYTRVVSPSPKSSWPPPSLSSPPADEGAGLEAAAGAAVSG